MKTLSILTIRASTHKIAPQGESAITMFHPDKTEWCGKVITLCKGGAAHDLRGKAGDERETDGGFSPQVHAHGTVDARAYRSGASRRDESPSLPNPGEER